MSGFTIQLHGLRFFAQHGLYSQEAAAGNGFEVNISMETAAPDNLPLSIADTVNYAAVYAIVQNVFAGREELLETLAMKIAAAAKREFPILKRISVQVQKLHPPIAAFTGSVSVTYTKDYEE